MKRNVLLAVALLGLFVARGAAQEPFTLEQVLSAPFPENLTAAKNVPRLAWTFNEQGQRNIWIADGPKFAARRLTSYTEDDGGALSSVSLSEDGAVVVYVRGEEKNPAGKYTNPTSNTSGAQMALWVVSSKGGVPRKIDEGGQQAQISSRGRIAYVKDGQIWLASADGSAKPVQIVVRGDSSGPQWSPDGTMLAFVSARGDHSFVAVYTVASQALKFISPSVDRDSSAAWSMDGKRIAFVRRPALPRDAPEGYFIEPDRPKPWAIWVAEVATGEAREAWHSSAKPEGSFPYMAQNTGGAAMRWAAGDTIVLASEEDGWQHLYALALGGGAPKLLTPGACEVEQWSFTPDRKTVLFNSNCQDTDRRHISIVSVDGGPPLAWTSGPGIEWSGVVLDDGKTFAYLGSDARNPAAVFVGTLGHDRSTIAVASELRPADFPADKLVVPEEVRFASAGGLEIHGQLFRPPGAGGKRPAVVFLHGGSMRQMLLGWHYMYYYSNCYALNQYLASRGFVVLAINFRSGIGYGRAFREAPGRAGRGATEYQDVVAAGKYLAGRSDVDGKRIGLWGGSYGGYLTALGLGRNSDRFRAGVDLHGVHDWPTDNWDGKNIPPELVKLAHDSSPVTAVGTWKSPVLFIHGDDDRNVYFAQTVDLVARLRERHVDIEQLVFPDEVHDFLLHRNWLAAYHAASDFLDRKLKAPPAGPGNPPAH